MPNDAANPTPENPSPNPSTAVARVQPKQPGSHLNAGGNWGNKGGGRKPDWLKARMAAALRMAKGPEVIAEIISGDIHELVGVDRQGQPIIGTTRNADRLRAIDLAAELAGLKPKDVKLEGEITVSITFDTP